MIETMSVGLAFLIILFILFSLNPVLHPIVALNAKNCQTSILTSLSPCSLNLPCGTLFFQ